MVGCTSQSSPFVFGRKFEHIFLIFDVLHIVDLGVTAHIVGSALFYMIYRSDMIANANTIQEKLTYLWAEIERAAAGEGITLNITSLSTSMFTNSDSPGKTYPSLRTLKSD